MDRRERSINDDEQARLFEQVARERELQPAFGHSLILSADRARRPQVVLVCRLFDSPRRFFSSLGSMSDSDEGRRYRARRPDRRAKRHRRDVRRMEVPRDFLKGKIVRACCLRLLSQVCSPRRGVRAKGRGARVERAIARARCVEIVRQYRVDPHARVI